MRSRAIRRLQEPARWMPEALLAMPLTPWARHLNLRGRPRRLQRPAHGKPIEAGTLPTFIDTPTATAKQKQKPEEKFVTLLTDAEQPKKKVSARRRFPENSVSRDFQIPLPPVPQTHRCMFLSHKDRYLHVNCHPTSEKTAFRNVRGQRKRDRILDRGPTSPTHCKAPGASQHGPVRCRRSGRQVDITTNPVVTLVTEQRQNGSYKCELWQKALSRLSVPMQTSTQERQNARRCEVFSPLQQST